MARAPAKSSRPARSCSRFTPATFIAVPACSARSWKIWDCRASAPLAGFRLNSRHGYRYPWWLDRVVFQAELAKERDVGIGGRIVSGEKFVAVEDGIRAGEERKSLAFAGNSGATSSEPDPCAWKRE